MCDMNDSYVWHDSFICSTWLIHMCDMTHSYVWHDSFIWMTSLSHMYDMPPSYVWHDQCRHVVWICMFGVPHSHVWHNSFMRVWHDSFIYVTWLIHDSFTRVTWRRTLRPHTEDSYVTPLIRSQVTQQVTPNIKSHDKYVCDVTYDYMNQCLLHNIQMGWLVCSKVTANIRIIPDHL